MLDATDGVLNRTIIIKWRPKALTAIEPRVNHTRSMQSIERVHFSWLLFPASTALHYLCQLWPCLFIRVALKVDVQVTPDPERRNTRAASALDSVFALFGIDHCQLLADVIHVKTISGVRSHSTPCRETESRDCSFSIYVWLHY